MPKTRKCDGVENCYGGEDEELCPGKLYTYKFFNHYFFITNSRKKADNYFLFFLLNEMIKINKIQKSNFCLLSFHLLLLSLHCMWII